MRLTFFLTVTCTLVSAQLTGPVGPTTTTGDKSAVICNVLDYGGSIGSSDIGPAISDAFNNCVRKHPEGSTLYVPPGNYNMATLVTLNKGEKWAFQLDGVITRATTKIGHMVIVLNANDFEFYSSTSAGGFQGNGYLSRNAGPRFLRIASSTNFSVHDVIFVDSPTYHLIIDTSTNGELYNLVIRGADIGGSDGIDIWGDNLWIHDVEVTNRDECVNIKSPASNILVERVWCNQSAGCTIGSLREGTAIANVTYRDIYTNGGDYMFMIKSNGGSGSVQNVLFENFLAHGADYGLDVDQYWYPQPTASGAGVQLSNITARGWRAIVPNGVSRSPVRFRCADGAPCTDMVVDDVQIWSVTGKETYSCQSAWGTGGCLKQGNGGSYPLSVIAVNSSALPDLPTLDGDLTAGFPSTAPIPMPVAIPTTFYPGLPQISPLAVNKAR